jgi:hypothetical protein
VPVGDGFLPENAGGGRARADDGQERRTEHRHFLLCHWGRAKIDRVALVTPPDTTAGEWQAERRDLAEQVTTACRAVDPASTDEIIELAHAADVVEGETSA